MPRTIQQQKELRAQRRALAIDLLGGECVGCGSTENLQFDHVHNDRDGLRGLVSQLFCSKLERLIVELEKCQLLCPTCHAKKTASDLERHSVHEHFHGTISMYTNEKCRCEDCRYAWANYMRVYKARVAS